MYIIINIKLLLSGINKLPYSKQYLLTNNNENSFHT